MVTGVARGVAEHLRVRPILVRLAFIVLATPPFAGLGVLLYVALWAVLPSETGKTPWRDRQHWPAFALLGLGVLFLTVVTGRDGSGVLFGWLAAIVALGVGVIWHQVKPDDDWLTTIIGAGGNRSAVLRLGGGGVLVATGVIGVLVAVIGLNRESIDDIVNSLLFTAIALVGVGLVFGPLFYRMFLQLNTEREGRIREAERADLAAMVHDQVLHTLALIQRRSHDPREVARLARGQERVLRNWLYKPTAEGANRFGAALEAAAAEVEDSFGISVDTVIVGDRDMDPHIFALVAAAREAMVNAAKHSGVDSISLYAEVEPDVLSVFVRDRGVGFDPDEIADDRHGVRGSILDRMHRHGGTAEVRSAAGEGTEVRLSIPVDATAE